MDLVGGGGGEAGRARAEAFRRRQAPENEVPVSIAWDAVLLESADVVVFVAGARVYSTGLEFTVVANARREPEPGPGGLSHGLLGFRGEQGDLLIGAEFADGRTASTAGGMAAALAASDPAAPDAPTLTSGGGGGGSRHATRSLFLTPLPDGGPLRIVAAWQAMGLDERTVELVTEPVAAARAGVRRLWDVEPPRPHAPRPPDVPRGGWFERHQQAPGH